MELKVRMGPKGQIVIPKIFRESYKIYPNQQVVMQNDENGLLITNGESNIVEKLREMARGAARKRKGKKFKYDKSEFYEQYEKRAKKTEL